MNHKFDELTKSMAQSVTRRAALKRFGVGLVGMALACFGLANKGESQTACLQNGSGCHNNSDCCSGNCRWRWVYYPLAKNKVKVAVCEP